MTVGYYNLHHQVIEVLRFLLKVYLGPMFVASAGRPAQEGIERFESHARCCAVRTLSVSGSHIGPPFACA